MFIRIATNDFRNLRADRSALWIGILFLGMAAYAVINGFAWARFQQKALEDIRTEESQRLSSVKRNIVRANSGRLSPSPFRDPRNPSAVGNSVAVQHATMPPGVLAPLAVGQSDLLPYYLKVTLRSRDALVGGGELENPVHLLFGQFDLAFVFLYVYPLLILTLGYNMISGEREAGTLALTLSHPITLQQLVLGKVVCRGVFILASAAGLSVAAAIATGVPLNNGEALTRLLVWIAVMAAFGAFWFAAAVLVSALGKSSVTNALALSALWIFFTLLIPSFLNVTAQTAHPIPSRVEMIQAMREATDAATAERSRLMARYLEDHPDLTGASAETLTQLAVRNVVIAEEIDRRMDPVLREFDQQLKAQQEIVNRYQFLSPAILAQAALFDLAGRSNYRYHHFVRQAETFHSTWQRHLRPLILRDVRMTPSDIEALPKFEYQEEPLSSVMKRAAAAIAGLTLLAGLITLAALPLLDRYRIAAS